MVGYGGDEGNNLTPGSTDEQSLTFTSFGLLFSIDFVSTATGIEFSEEGGKKRSTNHERKRGEKKKKIGKVSKSLIVDIQ